MRPPDNKKPADRAGSLQSDSPGGRIEDKDTHPAPRAQWRVEIVRPDDGRVKVWNTYADREAAELEAAKLCAVKLFAQVRRVDDGPEYRTRRQFLIAMFMINAIGSERLVERICADIEQEIGS